MTCPTALRLHNLEVTQTRKEPQYEYELDVVADVTGAALDEDESVIEFESIPDEISSIIRDAIINSPYETNIELPEKIYEILDEYDYIRYPTQYFHGDETPSTRPTILKLKLWRNNIDRPPLLQFDVDVVDAEITQHDPGKLLFQLEYRGQEVLEIKSMDPWPFGVPQARHTNSPDSVIQLWNNRYPEFYPVSKYDDIPGNFYTYRVHATPDQIQSGEPITAEYELPYEKQFPTGTYKITGRWHYKPSDCRKEVVAYTVTFSINGSAES